jgi:EmrB/QacA subfamily drug resistance transporter
MTATTTRAPGQEISPATWHLAWLIALGGFAAGLDTSLVNIALDTIRGQFGIGLGLAQWIASGYLLALAVALPACAWLGRRMGTGRVWLAAVAAFTVISVLCAAAPSIGALIVFRVLQGLAAGILLPTGQTLLGQAVGAARLGRVMSRLGIAVSLAPALGPAIGGLMLEAVSWRWLFLMNVPLGVIAFAGGLRLLPRDSSRDPAPLDWIGYLLVGAGLPLLVYGFTTWGERGTPPLAPLAAGAVAMAGFGWQALRASRPVLDLRLFGDRGYVAAAFGFFFAGVLMFGSALLFPLYFQMLHADSVVVAGLKMLPYGVGTAVVLPLGGQLTDKYGGGPVATAGGLLAVAATGVFAVVIPGLVLTEILLFVLGGGGALTATPLMTTAMRLVGPAKLPDAVAQVNILLRLGGAVGAALFSALVAHGLAHGASSDGFHLALDWQFATAIGILASSIGVWRLTRAPDR